MERRRASRRQAAAASSPERSPVWAEPPPPPLKQGTRMPVVYYLCRNHQLEHPHFVEVPVSSPEGLYLRDVIGRLNALRGKTMPSMYSWSCKRSYRSGFVWHDLSEDDLILPAHGNEYILKGTELLDQSPHPSESTSQHGTSDDHFRSQSSRHPQQGLVSFTRTQEASSSSSSPPPAAAAAPPPLPSSPLPLAPKEDVFSPPVAHNAATQTDDRGGREEACIRGVSTDEIEEIVRSKQNAEIKRDGDISPSQTSWSAASSCRTKADTLESLMRAEAKNTRFMVLGEDEVLVSTRTRLKATNLLMHLITCGSISIKDRHGFGLIPAYRPKFFHADLGSPIFGSSEKLGLDDKEYFSGSLIEAKKHQDYGEGVPTLKRSSSYDAESHSRSCISPDLRRDSDKKMEDSSLSKCLPRTIKMSSSKQSKSEMTRSPVPSDVSRASTAALESFRYSPLRPPSTVGGGGSGSGRSFTDAASPAKGSSMRLESFKEVKENVFEIEERLASGARVIIRSTAPLEDDK